jgi:DNA repair protein RecN (Recombination protein N)
MSLQALHLRQIAVFESQQLHIPTGMTVIAGEAGAGKSLLIDALDWIFGASASAKDVLRHGAERGQVGLMYRLTAQHSPRLWDALDAEGIELERLESGDCELEITREFSTSGSRFRINGSSVSRAFMQDLRGELLDLHSQHSTVTLMQQPFQQQLLDAFGGVSHQQYLEAVQRVYTQWKEAHNALQSLEQERQSSEQRVHLLRLQVQELDALNLTNPHEDEALEAEINRLAHAEQLKSAYAETQHLMGFSGGDEEAPNILDALGFLSKRLGQVEASEKRLSPVLDQLEAVREQLRELGHQIHSLDEEVDLNPQRLDELQSRLNDLQKLKRLYGPSLQDVIHYWENASLELADLEDRYLNPDALQAQVKELAQRLEEVCQQLSQARQALAERLESQVQASLSDLAMPHAQFQIHLEACPANAYGKERVQFLFSANPGEGLKPLGKVASGGELSRVLLALTVASLPQDAQGASKLYVFDEIDTGTSGQAAKTIGLQLQRLANAGHQVLVVTHQAVVAAAAHQHWWVRKVVEAGTTVSQVQTTLTQDETLHLLTHLASGESDTQNQVSRQFAESLLEQMQSKHNQAKTACSLV